MTRIIVTRALPDPVERRLRSRFECAFNHADAPFARERLEAAMEEADGILATVSETIDASLLALPQRRVKIVAQFGVGVNNIDLEAARRAGVVVTNTPDVLTDATADLAMALILAATRRMREAEAALRRGEWTGFAPTQWLGMGLQGKTLGIIGFGRIGRAVARRAHLGFGMRVIWFNRSPVADPGFPASRRTSIEAVMEEADVVSLHIPGGAENRGIISAERLARMQPGAYLVNTARGDVVDEAALVAMLKERRIAGAGLDVFAKEPRVPRDLAALDSVTLLPHIGSATIETRTAMGMLAVDNLEAFFDGGKPPSRVA